MIFKVLSVSFVLLTAVANAQLKLETADEAFAGQNKASFAVAGEMLKGAVVNEASLANRTVVGYAITAQTAPGVLAVAKQMYDAMVAGKIDHAGVDFNALAELVANSHLGLGAVDAVAAAANTGKLTAESLTAGIASAKRVVINGDASAVNEVPAMTVLSVVGATDMALSPGQLPTEDQEKAAAELALAILTTGAAACAADGDAMVTCVRDGLASLSNHAKLGVLKLAGSEQTAALRFQRRLISGFQDEAGRATTGMYYSGANAISSEMVPEYQDGAAELAASGQENISLATVDKFKKASHKHYRQCALGQAI